MLLSVINNLPIFSSVLIEVSEVFLQCISRILICLLASLCDCSLDMDNNFPLEHIVGTFFEKTVYLINNKLRYATQKEDII